MISLGIYLLESSICLICFYGIFYFLLKNETWFQLNRWYLLSAILFSVSIPLFHYSIDVPVLINAATEGSVVISKPSNPELSEIPKTTFFTLNNLWNLLLGIYVLGMIVSSSIFIKGLLHLRGFYTKGKKENRDGVTYVFGENDNNIFSFFNYIFVNKEIENYTEKQQQQIINHELAHIKDKHSLDLLILELFKIVFWFNPVILAYKKSMLQLHEYIADEKVLEEEDNVLEYASFLVNQVKENTRVYSFCNHLFHKPIKNRLIMMNKSKSKRRNAIMAFSFIPVLAGMIFNFSIEYQEIPVNIAEKENNILPLAENDSIPLDEIEEPDIPTERDKCYGKSTIYENEEFVEKISLNVFTGNDASGIDTEIREIVIKPAQEKWVKKRISADSAELVWCLVEIAPVVEEFVVVKDIGQTKEYETRTFEIREIIKGKEYLKWQELVCPDDMTVDLIKELQIKLKAMGYDMATDGIFNMTTQLTLGEYQKDNGLPVGNLNMATVKSLALEI